MNNKPPTALTAMSATWYQSIGMLTPTLFEVQHGTRTRRERGGPVDIGGPAAWPLGRAQQGDRVRLIGVLNPGVETDPVRRTSISAFTQALAALGWTDGRNVRMDLRWGRDDTNRIRALAQELVGLQPDIILANGTPATVALQRGCRKLKKPH